jgi:hypothetical protein
MSQGSVLLDVLSSNFAKKKKKKKRKENKETKGRKSQRGFPRVDMLGFPWLLSSIKRCFKGQYLIFMCTLCVGSYLIGQKESEVPKYSSLLLKWFLKSSSSGILIPSPIHHLGSSYAK